MTELLKMGEELMESFLNIKKKESNIPTIVFLDRDKKKNTFNIPPLSEKTKDAFFNDILPVILSHEGASCMAFGLEAFLKEVKDMDSFDNTKRISEQEGVQEGIIVFAISENEKIVLKNIIEKDKEGNNIIDKKNTMILKDTQNLSGMGIDSFERSIKMRSLFTEEEIAKKYNSFFNALNKDKGN